METETQGTEAAPPAATTTTGSEQGIPPARLAEVSRDRDAAREQAAQAQAALAEARAQAEQYQAARDALAVDLTMAERGLTSAEARTVARALHQALPEADRPDLAAWVQSLTPDAAPLGLRAYMAPAMTPAAATTTPAGPAAPPAATEGRSPASDPPSRVQALRAAEQRMASAIRGGTADERTAARAELERALSAVTGR